jgi:hypothetical protein
MFSKMHFFFFLELLCFLNYLYNMCHRMIEVWHFNLAKGLGASFDETNYSIQSWLRF